MAMGIRCDRNAGLCVARDVAARLSSVDPPSESYAAGSFADPRRPGCTCSFRGAWHAAFVETCAQSERLGNRTWPRAHGSDLVVLRFLAAPVSKRCAGI